MATKKKTPDEIMDEFRAAWALEHKPEDLELRYGDGWYTGTKPGYGRWPGERVSFIGTMKASGGFPKRVRAAEMEREIKRLLWMHEEANTSRRVKDSERKEVLLVDGVSVIHFTSLLEEKYSIELAPNCWAWAESRKHREADATPSMSVQFHGSQKATPEDGKRMAEAIEIVCSLAEEWTVKHPEEK